MALCVCCFSCSVLYCIVLHRIACIIVPHCTCVLVFLPALFCILPGLHQPSAPCPSPRLASPIEPARWESPPPLLAAALTCMSSRLASTQLHPPSTNPRTRQGHPTTPVSAWSSCTARLPGLHDAEPALAGVTARTWTWTDDILSAILLAASIFFIPSVLHHIACLPILDLDPTLLALSDVVFLFRRLEPASTTQRLPRRLRPPPPLLIVVSLQANNKSSQRGRALAHAVRFSGACCIGCCQHVVKYAI